MRKKKFLQDLGVQALVIVLVILNFKFMPDKKSASLIAGGLFLLTPSWRAWLEYRQARWSNTLWWLGVAQFLLLFALPIFFGRILNWSVEFEKISLFGVPLSLFHRFSSTSYFLMMLTTAIAYAMEKNKKALE